MEIHHDQQSAESEESFEMLPKEVFVHGRPLRSYKGFWFQEHLFQQMTWSLRTFHAKDTDIILATMPKAGTTWLKALVFSIVNRHSYPHLFDQSPLLTSNPHQLIPNLMKFEAAPMEKPTLHSMAADPRIIATHIPYQCLPDNISTNSNCRIIYLCRNVLDLVVSMWQFGVKNRLVPAELSVDKCAKAFYHGMILYGPFWDHVLGYWHASLKKPGKVLFLKYEDLKKDTISSVKKIADFLGVSFSAEEERKRVIEEITRLCSIEFLKNLEVNKTGDTGEHAVYKFEHSSFFRKGEVGDWANYLSPSIAKRLVNLMEEKFAGSGLTFDYLVHANQAATKEI